MKNKVGFKPYKGYIAIAIPEEAYPTTSLEFASKEAWKAMVDGKAKELTSGELEIVAIGEGVETVSVGTKIIVAGHGRLQQIEIDVKEKYPKLYWIVRESEILVILE